MTALDHRAPAGHAEEVSAKSPDEARRRRTPIALEVLLAAHGLAHFVGVVAAFESLESGEALEYLAGSWMVSNGVIVGLIGAMWAALGLGFLLMSIAVATEFRSWDRPLVLLGVISFAMCVLALWSAWIGLIVNGVLIVVAILNGGGRAPSAGRPRSAI